MFGLRRITVVAISVLFLLFVTRPSQSQTQSMTGNMITGRAGHSATLLSNGKVLIAGGYDYVNYGTGLSSAELYNPLTGTFSTTGSLNAIRQSHSGILLHDGTVLIYGGTAEYPGTDLDVVPTTAEIYNPTTGTFSAINAPSVSFCSATLLPSGLVLFTANASTGGQSGTDMANLLLYNPATQTFSSTGLTLSSVPAATLLANGTVLLTQAQTTYAQSSAEGFASAAEIYNPSTNTLSSTGSEIGTNATPALALGNGTVLLGYSKLWSPNNCSGYKGRGTCPAYGEVLNTSEQTYNVSSGTFTSGPAFSPLPGAPWTLLNDGSLLMYSNEDTEAYAQYLPNDVLQVYSPSVGTTSTTGTLVPHNGGATVTVLQNGTTLIAGGIGASGNATTAAAELYGDPGVTGIIHPKYVVVGVTYAPPGPNSYVSYANSVTVGTTNTIVSTLKTGESLSVSIGTTAGVPGWLEGSLTGTSTTSFTQQTSTTKTVTVSDQATLTFKSSGTPNQFSPVAHDYDIVWLWLNPVIQLTVNPNNPNGLTWNGYGFDQADQPALDIWPVFVGYLNGDFGPLDSEDAKVLARSWATGQTFPQSGQGPALTATDFAQILLSDPFSNPKYVFTLGSGTPPTTTDGRFTLSGGPSGQAQDFPYKQAATGGTAISEMYTNVYTNLSSVGKSTETSYEQAFSLDEKFNTGLFFDSLSVSITEMGSLTLTSEALTTINTTAAQTDTLYIQGPTCTGSPCNPQYAGPPEFDVYQDNLYGTFVFNPVN